MPLLLFATVAAGKEELDLLGTKHAMPTDTSTSTSTIEHQGLTVAE